MYRSVLELLTGKTEKIKLEPQTQFRRQKQNGIIYNVSQSKTLKTTFDKRRVLHYSIVNNELPKCIDTVPFGFNVPDLYV